MKHILYGDGIHDDLPAIQELLDSGTPLVHLPAPKAHYLISDAIRIHSNQELRLDRFARVLFSENVNNYMLINANPMEGNCNIRITGGIWDMNHNAQLPHPWNCANPETGRTAWQELTLRGFRNWIIDEGEDGPKKIAGRDFPLDVYTGFCMYFSGIRNFHISDLTIVNPPLYGMDLYAVEDFTVENITFEYTEGSPKKHNMDGVHIEGYCKNGLIRNLHGACHDDTVALTADDSYKCGPIENITIDGIYAEGAHSAVRLLSRVHPIRNVRVSNVYGSYYIYALTISKYSTLPERGIFENVSVDNVCVTTCEGTGDVRANYLPVIYVGEDIDIRNLTLRNLRRDERHSAVPTIGIGKGTHIHTLSLSDCSLHSTLAEPISLIHNDGTIDRLYLYNVETAGNPILSGHGDVALLKET